MGTLGPGAGQPGRSGGSVRCPVGQVGRLSWSSVWVVGHAGQSAIGWLLVSEPGFLAAFLGYLHSRPQIKPTINTVY